MAKYSITYKCGHTCDKQLFGSYKSRESYIEWAKDNKLCPECEEALVQENRRKENEVSAQDAQERGYIELQGSPKQVTWANSIRARVIAAIDEVQWIYEERAKESSLSPNIYEERYATINGLRDAVLSIADSKVFIDRYKDFVTEDAIRILKCKRAVKKGIVISDEEFKAKMLEYNIARIEKPSLINPIYIYIKEGDVNFQKRSFPELFE